MVNKEVNKEWVDFIPTTEEIWILDDENIWDIASGCKDRFYRELQIDINWITITKKEVCCNEKCEIIKTNIPINKENNNKQLGEKIEAINQYIKNNDLIWLSSFITKLNIWELNSLYNTWELNNLWKKIIWIRIKRLNGMKNY